MPPKSRIKSFDTLKALSILAVVILHTTAAATPDEQWTQLLRLCCRFAVPCFFMISGYFFMASWERSDQQGRNTLIIRYSTRLSLIFLFWSLFYAICPPFAGRVSGDLWTIIVQHLGDFLRYPHTLFFSGYVYHLWFLSSLLQALVFLWVCLRFNQLRLAIIVGATLFGIALLGSAYSHTPLGFHTRFDLKSGPFLSTLCASMGAWICRHKVSMSRSSAACLAASGLAVQFLEAGFLRHQYGIPLGDHDFTCGSIAYAAGLMLLMLATPDADAFGLASLGRYSLGIYAIHPYLIEVLRHWPATEWIIVSPFTATIAVWAFSVAVTLSLGKVPGVKRLVA